MTDKFTACASGYPEPEHEYGSATARKTSCYAGRVKMEREGNGLLRLITKHLDETSVGQYMYIGLLVARFQPERRSHLLLAGIELYDTMESRAKKWKPVGDQYVNFDRFRQSSGAHVPLPPVTRPWDYQ